MTGYEETFKYKLIYIMTIHDQDHEGLLKIGETTLDSTLGISQLQPNCEQLNAAAHARIKQYTKTALIKYELLYTELAVKPITMSDGSVNTSTFSDKDIQDVLSRSGYLNRKFPDSEEDSEWYQVDLDTAINAIKAFKAGRNVLSPSEKSNGLQKTKPNSCRRITLRQEQREAVDMALKVFKKDDHMLWDCKMRFGKTVSAYELIKEGNFQKSIIVTHRPVVETGWQDDHDLVFGENSKHLFVTKKINGSTYEYDESIDSENDRILRKYDRMGAYFSYFTSMQDLRGSKRVGGKYDKNNAVFDMDWDLIICDEAHEGTQTDLGQAVLDLLEKPKKGKSPKVLSLSGTPYNLYEKYGGNVYYWDYVMEQQRKKEYAEQHPDEYNPYADLPEMKILTFDLQKALPAAYRYETEDMAFNFREFFRTWTGDPNRDFRPIPDGKNPGDFVHEDDVINFLNIISADNEDSNYPFSTQQRRDMFRHTFWMVPGVREARALSKLLAQHPIFKNYKVANVAGEGDKEENYEDALAEVQSAISENKYTITISCGRLTMGVTVPEWSAVMMLSGSANTSASGYMQTIFRVQSVGCIDGKQKEIAYVFDFAPDRALKVLSEVHSISNRGKLTDEEAKKSLGEFLNFCPVIAVDGTKMTEYDVPCMMRQIRRLSVDRAIKSGFEDESIYNEGVGIIMDDLDVEIFNKLAERVHGKSRSKLPKSIIINKHGLTNEEYQKAEKSKNKPKRERTAEEEEAIKKQNELKKEREKVISLLRAVSIRLPLLIYGANVDISEDIKIEDFVDIVDNESWTEFMPRDISKSFFKQLLKYYDEDVIVAAGYRIRHLAKAADELPPTKRVQRIAEILSLFRNPDKETVLTPWRVVNMHMGDMIGGYNFYEEAYPRDNILDEPRFVDQENVTDNIFAEPEAQLLEMNSKSGLYPLYLAYSMYAKKLPKPECQMSVEETQTVWKETLTQNVFVLCKTKMAVSITNRTLAGYDDFCPVNVIYLPHLLDRMEEKDRLSRKLTNPKTWGKDGERLKFDAVVGNPPYQLTTGGGTEEKKAATQAKPVYNKFVEQAINLNPKYVSMIIPARWYSGGIGLDQFRNDMLHDKHITRIVDFVNSKDCFQSVDIAGGICYFLWDREHTSDLCKIINVSGDSVDEAERRLDEFGDLFVRSNEAINIINKVQKKTDKFMDEIVSAIDTFGIPSKEKGHSVQNEGDLLLLSSLGYNNQGVSYISPDMVKKNRDLIDKYKVKISIMVPQAGEVGVNPENGYRSISTPQVLPPGEVDSFSYLNVGFFDTENEANNLVSYMCCKFTRYLMRTTYSSVHISKDNFKFVPLVDFSKSWTDEELFDLFDLDEKERNIIEKTMRPIIPDKNED